jgi:hypothetical protein
MRWLLIFLVLLVGCTQPVHHPTNNSFYRATILLHGDTGFTQDERTSLDYTVIEWNHIVNGAVKVAIRWDLIATSTKDLIEHQDDNLLLRGHSTNYLGEAADQMANGKILGWVDNDLHAVITKPQKVFLMIDRLDDKKLRRVFLHELFHVAGMEDIQAPGFLMSRQFNWIDCPSRGEMKSFCDKWHCDVEDTIYCN